MTDRNKHSLLIDFAKAALTGLLADPEDIECEPGKSCEESVAIKAFRIAEQMVKLAYEN